MPSRPASPALPAEGHDADDTLDPGIAHDERESQDPIEPVAGGERARRGIADRGRRDRPSLEEGAGDRIGRRAAVEGGANRLVGGKRRRARHAKGPHEAVVAGGRDHRGRRAPVGEGDGEERVEGGVEVGGTRDSAGGPRQERTGIGESGGLGHDCLHARSRAWATRAGMPR